MSESYSDYDEESPSPYSDSLQQTSLPIFLNTSNGDEESVDEDVTIDRDLLGLTSYHLNSVRDENRLRGERETIFSYNWQTKELTLPNQIKQASEAITKFIEICNDVESILDSFTFIPKNLKPEALSSLEESLQTFDKNKRVTKAHLESFVSAIVLYWFPKTTEHLKLGAYKHVRQPTEKLFLPKEDFENLKCSVCCESMVTNNVPVCFRRRCNAIPVLKKKCDLQECKCKLPSICLMCCLSHLLQNCIHQRKSSVTCPACRGEFCIYDIQELQVLQTTVESEEMDRLKKENIRLMEELKRAKDSVLYYQNTFVENH